MRRLTPLLQPNHSRQTIVSASIAAAGRFLASTAAPLVRTSRNQPQQPVAAAFALPVHPPPHRHSAMSTPASVSSSASPSPSSASAEAPASAASGVDTGSFPVVDLAALPNPMAHVRAVSVVPLHFAEPRKPVRFEDGWDYYRRIGSPKTVCAPMVNQSELAFRLLCRRYATDVCYTPMFHAEIFGKDASYRADAMQLPPVPSADRPLVAQFCGNNPQLILKAARHVEHLVDAVDINLGCPQGIAKRGNYGSFLLEEYQLLHDIVSTLHQHLSIPVTCKIRRLKTDEATVALVRMLQEAGAALITIHGRTRHQLKDKVGACDFDIIRLVKQNCSVPVFANGGIYDLSDVQRCLAYTGVDGVMSSEALLCNPSIFSGKRVDSIEIAKEYMTIVREIESTAPTEQSMIRAHLFKMLYQHLGLFHDLRDKLAHCDPADFDAVIAEIEARFEGKTAQEKQAMLDTVPLWYHRHIQTPAQKAAAEEKARLKKKQQEEDAAAARDDEADGLDAFNLFEECDNDGCGNQQQCS